MLFRSAGNNEYAQAAIGAGEQVMALPNTAVDAYYNATGGIPQNGTARAAYNLAQVLAPIAILEAGGKVVNKVAHPTTVSYTTEAGQRVNIARLEPKSGELQPVEIPQADLPYRQSNPPGSIPIINEPSVPTASPLPINQAVLDAWIRKQQEILQIVRAHV